MTRNRSAEEHRNKQDTETDRMLAVAREALEDARGVDILTLDVRNLTDMTDCMVIVTGTSDRHVRTLSDRVQERMKQESWTPLGVEGEASLEWVLVDYVDIVVHVMRERVRRHYDLEGLWDDSLAERNDGPDNPDGAVQTVSGP